MPELVDIVNERFYINDFLQAVQTITPEKVNHTGDAKKFNYRCVATFEDGEQAALFITVNGLMGKCTCLRYETHKPCEHLIATFNAMKEKLGEKTIQWLHSKEEEEKEEDAEEEELKFAPPPESKKRQQEHLEELSKSEEVKAEVPKGKYKHKFLGKVTVLYGQPLSGKTTFAMMLCKEFKHPVIIKVDRNYRVEDYGVDAKVYNINHPKEVLEAIRKTPAYKDTIVVVDSITSLDAFFMPEDPTKDDLRMANKRARFCDSVMLGLQKFRKDGAVLVIAHEAIKDFNTKEVGPRMNNIALRHADQVLRAYKDKGEYIITANVQREVVKEPKFKCEF